MSADENPTATAYLARRAAALDIRAERARVESLQAQGSEASREAYALKREIYLALDRERNQ